MHNKWWLWVFVFIQLSLPQVIRTKTWTSRGHVKILDSDIIIEDNIIVCKLFDKGEIFPPLFYLWLICRAIFCHKYSVIEYFQSSYEQLYVQTDRFYGYGISITQCGNKASILCQIRKALQIYFPILKHFQSIVRHMTK